MTHFIRSLATSAAVMGATLALTGCDANISIGESDGVPLSELDLTGAAPTELVLAAPDLVEISEGESLAITVEGSEDAKQQIRFKLDDGSLAIMREDSDWGDSDKATIRVTMPAVTDLTLAGSGTIAAGALASNADITIAGSGTINTPNVAAETLALTVAGSGSYVGAGTAKTLELTIAGSGQANMKQLTTADADISIVGSGDAAFASDGNVEATIMGSGTVNVVGDATCESANMGSGELVCQKTAALLTSDRNGKPSDLTQTVSGVEAGDPSELPAPSRDAASLRAEAEAKRAEATAARAEAEAIKAEAEALQAEARAGD